MTLAEAASGLVPEKQWSEPEQWAWREIRAGRIADFNQREGGELDPNTPDGWNEGRKLRSDFLKEILFRQPYRNAIPVEGVRLVGAWFANPIDLAHGRLERQLWLEKCRFEKPVTLAGLQIDGWFSLEGSVFAEQGKGATSVDLDGARISGHVSMRRVTVAGALAMDLPNAKVGGQLAMDARPSPGS